MGPLRTGFRYGLVAVVVALAADLRFLVVDPEGIPNWVLTVIEDYRTQLALAAFLFLGILAALRVRPTHIESDVPYRSLLLRDGALAATVVAVMAGLTLFVVTALNATLFADEIRDYASAAAPNMGTYYEKVAGRLDDPPPLPTVEEIERRLQPPELRDLGRSMANLVLRAILIGAAGALIGVLRGGSQDTARETGPRLSGNGKSPEG